ncbi:MAG: AAA family ATPase [Candidatus Methylomirabilis sp.]|nr:AAA family ATPase [Deltaproteobacteria bacterium]
MKSELGSIGLPRLLHLIYLKQDETAVLDIMKEPVKKRFFFRRGLPVAASSNVLGEVLGRLLMHEGIISEKEYEGSLEAVLRERKRHGEVLISMGLLTKEKLEEFLRLQLKRRLLKVFDWEEGSYRYVKAPIPEGLPDNPLHPAELILEGISLGFYPVSNIKKELGSYMDKRLSLHEGEGPYKLEDFRFNLQEMRFIETLYGGGTLEEALGSSDLLRHRALSIALALVMTGLLKESGGSTDGTYELKESAPEARAPEAQVDSQLNAELLFMRAKAALQKKDFRSAINMLKDITTISPGEGEYWAALGWAIYNDDPGRIAEAERLLKDSIDLNNDLDGAWLYLGKVFLAQGRTEEAGKAFSTAISKNPWNTEALSGLKRLTLNSRAPQGAGPFAGFPPEPPLSGAEASSLESLVKAVRKHSGPVLLTGEPGAGKTTVLLELLKRVSQDKVLAALVLRPSAKELDFVKELNSELGSNSDARTVKDQLLNLGMRVSQNKIQGGQSLVIIDGADSLSPGCLKLVQYLTRLKTLQIILSAGPGLAERLKDPAFKELDERLSTRIMTGGMTSEETALLIESRAKSAKGEAAVRVALSAPDPGEIFEKTGGIPGAALREAAAVFERTVPRAAGQTGTALREAVPVEPGPEATAGVLPEAVERGPQKPELIELMEYEHVLEPAAPEPFNEASSKAAPPEKAAEVPAPTVSSSPGNKSAQLSAPEKPLPREEATGQKETTVKSVPSKKGASSAILWIILLLVAAIAAGYFIWTLWSKDAVEKEEPIALPAPIEKKFPGPQGGPVQAGFEKDLHGDATQTSPIHAETPDQSLDTAPQDGE